MNGLRAAGATLDAAAITHGTAPLFGHTDRAASTSYIASDKRPVEGLSRHSRQHIRGTWNMSPPLTPNRGHQTHLHRLQDGSTAALRCHSDHEPAKPLKAAGHANTAAAAPQSNAVMDHARAESNSGQVLASGSATTAQDVQTQEGLARAKHLQQLEAAAAKWRQRSGSNSSILANQPRAVDSDCISMQTAIPSDEITDPRETPSWQLQRAFFNAESDSYGPQSAEPGAGVGVAAGPEYDDQQLAFESSIGVPPPPSRPPKTSQAKTKASWLAALKGDAPPWLL